MVGPVSVGTGVAGNVGGVSHRNVTLLVARNVTLLVAPPRG